MVDRNVVVYMERPTLDDLPDCPLPSGFSTRWFRPGDDKTWIDIHDKAEKHVEISPEVFSLEFGSDWELLGRRQCYLLDSASQAIATATAWFDDDYHGQPYGRLHWVAVVPEYQGRGLAKPLLKTVLRRMRELGHEKAYLRTSTARPVAVNLYKRFGFVPALRSEEDRAVWQQLNPLLPEPFELP